MFPLSDIHFLINFLNGFLCKFYNFGYNLGGLQVIPMNSIGIKLWNTV